MLRLDCRYSEAEDVLRTNLQRRKRVFGSDHVTMYRDSRDVQLQLCQVLRKQREDRKTIEAEVLYEKHAFLRRLDGKADASREWTFRNAVGLAGAQVERRDYKHAMPQLRDVWEERLKAPDTYNHELHSEVLDIIAVLERRSETQPLIEALKVVCYSDPREVDTSIIPCYTQLGRLLHETGGKKANEEAITYLQDALAHRDRLDIDDQRSALWALALSQASLDCWEEVKKLLGDLRKYDNSQGTPSADMLTALKARLQLNAGEFSTAEATAAGLWDKHNTKNVLHPSANLHQVDTLIKAASKQKQKDRFTQAKMIWDEVYACASNGGLSKAEM